MSNFNIHVCTLVFRNIYHHLFVWFAVSRFPLSCFLNVLGRQTSNSGRVLMIAPGLCARSLAVGCGLAPHPTYQTVVVELMVTESVSATSKTKWINNVHFYSDTPVKNHLYLASRWKDLESPPNCLLGSLYPWNTDCFPFTWPVPAATLWSPYISIFSKWPSLKSTPSSLNSEVENALSSWGKSNSDSEEDVCCWPDISCKNRNTQMKKKCFIMLLQTARVVFSNNFTVSPQTCIFVKATEMPCSAAVWNAAPMPATPGLKIQQIE